MQLRYLYRQPGPHFVFDTTRSGVEAGRYESYVGVNPNEVEVTVVDGNNNALSPTVTIALSGSNCWWVLNWKRNN